MVARTWSPAPSKAQLTEPSRRIPAEELALQADGTGEFITIFSLRTGKGRKWLLRPLLRWVKLVLAQQQEPPGKEVHQQRIWQKVGWW